MTGLKYTLIVRNPEGDPVALLQGQPVPGWASNLVHADDIDGPADDGGFGSMTKDELKAEIDARNADRDDDAKIVPDGGNKPDLVAALEADADSKS